MALQGLRGTEIGRGRMKAANSGDMKNDETIFAFASGTSRAAIAVLRLSGPATWTIVKALTRSTPEPRRATLVTFADPATGEKIDRGLVIFFPSPRSFTGEDYAEFHVHGSRAVAAALIEALSAQKSAQPAEPGEFTRRAFLNGKMDLAQVEGLGDLIDAETAAQHRLALRQMEGALGNQAAVWRRALIEASAMIEAEIDFSDEADVPRGTSRGIVEILAPVLTSLEAELAHAKVGELIREGLTVVIAGPPNAGKSTLMNALARRDVAIVSAVPGTTRDALEVHLDLEGFYITLIDTAGLRPTVEPIESIGVERALARAKTADLVLWLSEPGVPADPPPDLAGPALWHLMTKIDLAAEPRRTLASGHLGLSAATGENLDVLVQRIAEYAKSLSFGGWGGLITRERHRRAFESATIALSRILCDPDAPVELLAEDLRLAQFSLQRLTGAVDVEDILGDIFARFCIGK